MTTADTFDVRDAAAADITVILDLWRTEGVTASPTDSSADVKRALRLSTALLVAEQAEDVLGVLSRRSMAGAGTCTASLCFQLIAAAESRSHS